MNKLNKGQAVGLSAFALVMLITGAIDSIRNLPATALFGSSLIFFFVFSAIVFLIPAALVSAELSSRSTDKSGIFHWVYESFGEKIAFLAIWLQWINTMVWFPTILSFLAGTLSYFINPALVQNKLYLVSIILSLFWLLTLFNLKGLHFSSKLSSFCAVVGMIIPMALIVILAIVWLLVGNPLQIHFTTTEMFPSLGHAANWVSLTAIMASFLGMELATVHVKEVRNPQKTFPSALFFSVLLILATMILGSLAIAMVLPKNQINLVNGVMQAFTQFFAMYHLSKLMPVITVMLLLGTLGSMVSWVISPAKGLLTAAQLGYLPPFFTHENKQGVATPLLITQAILVSIVCLAFLLMPSVNGSYWLLTALSTQLYVLMYVLMFLAAICLKYKAIDRVHGFTIPGGKLGMWFTCLFGLIGCGITLCVGFIPPAGIDVGGILHYEIVFCSGLIGMVLPVLLFYWYKKKRCKNVVRWKNQSGSLLPLKFP
ncbi:MAG: gadC [Gammaproteobacteria bacterium]|jgi:amino acid transporter|nr:gadC [Gammaproteobacteria bacterium]